MAELGLVWWVVGMGLVLVGFVCGLVWSCLPTRVEMPMPVVEEPSVVRVEKVIEREVVRPRVVGEPWRVEFYSGSGRRKLGEATLRSRRQPGMSYVGVDGLVGDFVAHRQRPDGVWEYRRVGVQRPS